MEIGLYIFATEYAIRIDELAREAEARGFESLWVPEHTHIPVSRRTPFPGGEPLPREYSHTLDPFVALTAAAAATQRLKVGTGICLVIERDPIITAKEVASLDLFSGGRFLFGVGAGWNVEEMENHGTAYKTRYSLLAERVRAMKAIWTQEAAEFHGRFVNFDPIWSWPKPLQRPHPPVLVGGEGPQALRRVVELGDGWFPRARNPEHLFRALERLREEAARAGRDLASLSLSGFGAPADPALLDRLRAAGFTRAILRVPSEGRDRVLPLLDDYARLLR